MNNLRFYVVVAILCLVTPCSGDPPGKGEPREMGPKEAIEIAEKYVKDNEIDVGNCRIQEAAFRRKNKREFWIVSWGFKDNRVGDCYTVIVFADGEITGYRDQIKKEKERKGSVKNK
jgi:hypothetical protein